MQGEVRGEGSHLVVIVDGAVWFRGSSEEAERFLSELLGLSSSPHNPRRRLCSALAQRLRASLEKSCAS